MRLIKKNNSKIIIFIISIFIISCLIYCDYDGSSLDSIKIPKIIKATPQIPHTGYIDKATISYDGKYIATVSNMEVIIWNKEQIILHKFIIPYTSFERNVREIFFTKDNQKIIILTNNNQEIKFSLRASQIIGIRDITEKEAVNLEKEANKVKNNKYKVKINNNISRNIEFSIYKNNKVINKISLPQPPIIIDKSVSINKEYIVGHSNNNFIYLWNIFSAELITSINLSNYINNIDNTEILSVHFNYIKDKFFLIDNKGMFYCWDTKDIYNPNLIIKRKISNYNSKIEDASISYNGDKIILLYNFNYKSIIEYINLSFNDDSINKIKHSHKLCSNKIEKIAISYGGDLIGVSYDNNDLKIFDDNFIEKANFNTNNKINIIKFSFNNELLINYYNSFYIESFSIKNDNIQSRTININIEYPITSFEYIYDLFIVSTAYGDTYFYNIINNKEPLFCLKFLNETGYIFYTNDEYFIYSFPIEIQAVEWLEILPINKIKKYNNKNIILNRIRELLGILANIIYSRDSQIFY